MNNISLPHRQLSLKISYHEQFAFLDLSGNGLQAIRGVLMLLILPYSVSLWLTASTGLWISFLSFHCTVLCLSPRTREKGCVSHRSVALAPYGPLLQPHIFLPHRLLPTILACLHTFPATTVQDKNISLIIF